MEAALPLARDRGLRAEEAAVQFLLGKALHGAGEIEPARACFERSLEIGRAVGDRRVDRDLPRAQGRIGRGRVARVPRADWLPVGKRRRRPHGPRKIGRDLQPDRRRLGSRQRGLRSRGAPLRRGAGRRGARGLRGIAPIRSAHRPSPPRRGRPIARALFSTRERVRSSPGSGRWATRPRPRRWRRSTGGGSAEGPRPRALREAKLESIRRGRHPPDRAPFIAIGADAD